MENHYDLIIIGGGMVGASLACALGGKPLRVAVVEAAPAQTPSPASYDDRAIALAYGARRIFSAMGLWEQLAAEVEPIIRIHVSERGRWGVVRLDAAEEGVEALGYVLASRVLGPILMAELRRFNNLDFIAPADVQGLSVEPDRVRVTLRAGKEDMSGSEISARLVVAADGADSQVRKALEIPTTRWRYGQTAVAANVTPAADHDRVAYERFTDSGPLALLPLSDGRCALIWTLRQEQTETAMNWSDGIFIERLQEQFGYRLGRLLRVGRRFSYPLQLVRAKRHTAPRVALIGNAAHSLHPVAGQGFNLGMRDLAVLADLVTDELEQGGDIGGERLLRRYEQWRRRDHSRIIILTDGMARLFSNPLPLLGKVRSLGLLTLDLLPGAKHALARQTMGLAGRQPRLGRGLPL